MPGAQEGVVKLALSPEHSLPCSCTKSELALLNYDVCKNPSHCSVWLQRILRSKPTDRIMIFCTTKRMCDQLSHSIAREFRSAAIHGDKRQQERDYVLNAFKQGQISILVATDVAARGLDIPNVNAVINYDFPTGVEDYIHRIGRTGRAGKSGESYTFFTQEDAKHARELAQVGARSINQDAQSWRALCSQERNCQAPASAFGD
eukprot:1154237-Pelagomonas_calceolata.AAC.15